MGIVVIITAKQGGYEFGLVFLDVCLFFVSSSVIIQNVRCIFTKFEELGYVQLSHLPNQKYWIY